MSRMTQMGGGVNARRKERAGAGGKERVVGEAAVRCCGRRMAMADSWASPHRARLMWKRSARPTSANTDVRHVTCTETSGAERQYLETICNERGSRRRQSSVDWYRLSFYMCRQLLPSQNAHMKQRFGTIVSKGAKSSHHEHDQATVARPRVPGFCGARTFLIALLGPARQQSDVCPLLIDGQAALSNEDVVATLATEQCSPHVYETNGSLKLPRHLQSRLPARLSHKGVCRSPANCLLMTRARRSLWQKRP